MPDRTTPTTDAWSPDYSVLLVAEARHGRVGTHAGVTVRRTEAGYEVEGPTAWATGLTSRAAQRMAAQLLEVGS